MKRMVKGGDEGGNRVRWSEDDGRKGRKGKGAGK